MYVTTLTHRKRYIRIYRMKVAWLIWLIMIYLTVPTMEIDIPKRDIQPKSPSDCICRSHLDDMILLQIVIYRYYDVSEDEIIDLKWFNIFIEKQSFPRR